MNLFKFGEGVLGEKFWGLWLVRVGIVERGLGKIVFWYGESNEKYGS